MSIRPALASLASAALVLAAHLAGPRTQAQELEPPLPTPAPLEATDGERPAPEATDGERPAPEATDGERPAPEAVPPSGADTERDTYALTVELLPDTHEVAGSLRIRWRNRGTRPATELFFHLYPNAFADEGTVFMRESGGRLRGDRADGHGSIELLRIARVVDGAPHPLDDGDDELISGDHTQLRVGLGDAPVAVGAWIELALEFRTTLPPLFARTGYVSDFYIVAQFFPKLAVYEPRAADDPRSGWVSFPYHGLGEFYADFADYSASITLPADFVLAAPGELHEIDLSTDTAGGRRVYSVRAPRRHDFVFVAAPRLERIDSTLHDGGRAVPLQLFYPPDYDDAAELVAATTADAFADYCARYGPYGWDTLTVVLPPQAASGGAGMEYPGFFTAAGPPSAIPGLHIAHEEVTAHELAHQWFQSVIASNEVASAFLDEGLTDWVTGDYLQRRYGREASVFDFGPVELGSFEYRRLFLALTRTARRAPIASSVDEFHDFGEYGGSVYAGTASVLETIARTWGRARLHRTLGTYARDERFRHPRPADLYRAFSDEYGEWMVTRVLAPALERDALDALAGARIVGEDVRDALVIERVGAVAIPLRVRSWRGQDTSDTWLPGSHARLELPADPARTRVEIDPLRHDLIAGDRRDDALALRPHDPARSRVETFLLHALMALYGELGP